MPAVQETANAAKTAVRAVILADGPGGTPLTDRHPTCLQPVLDRPILQHVVERLASRGIRRIDVVATHWMERIEAVVGDGSRWGVDIRCHSVREEASPEVARKRLNLGGGEDEVLTVFGDRLPSFSDDGHLVECANEVDSAEISTRTPAALLAANLHALQFGDGLLNGGFEAEPGIWLSRNVSLHPTARLHGPVYICEDCQIGPGAVLGPNVVVGARCVVSRDSHLSDAVVFPGTFVGEHVDLVEAVVDRDLLHSVPLDAAVPGLDEFLGSAKPPISAAEAVHWLVRRSAAILLTPPAVLLNLAARLLLPLLGKRLRHVEVKAVLQPSPDEPGRWRTTTLKYPALESVPGAWGQDSIADLFVRFLWAIPQIAMGRMHFTGARPRTKEELLSMHPDRRQAALALPVGAVSEAFVHFGPEPTSEEEELAERMQHAARGGRSGLRLLKQYLLRLFGLRGRS